MKPSILLIALDGVGLGSPDPARNPIAAAHLPTLGNILEGRGLDESLEPFESEVASVYPVDATLGVEGNPESATGQATLFTGVNIAQKIGRHYGPKPNRRITALLRRHTLLRQVLALGRRATLWNAYPPAYFQSIQSGRRICSAIPMAFFFAGIPLRTDKQLLAGEAISADFTGEGWRMHNRDDRTPVFTPREAGRHLARLALQVDFSAVDHWPTDYAGHRGDHTAAVRLMEVLDEVLAGIIEESKGTPLTTIVSSDHGNMEDLGARGHTRHPVPALVFGPAETRAIFFRQKRDLTGFGAAILEVMRYSASA